MTGRPAPPSAMVEKVARALFAETHEESWEEAEELTRRIYLDEAPAGIAAMFDNLPREAMARGYCRIACCGQFCDLKPDSCVHWRGELMGTDAAISAARVAALGSAKGNDDA